MKILLLKSFLCAVGNHVAVVLFAGMITNFVVESNASDSKFLSTMLLVSLLTWFGMAAVLLLTVIIANKVTLSAVAARSIFLWVPISVGWFLTHNTGTIAWFPAGMMISSFFLFYEVLAFSESPKKT